MSKELTISEDYLKELLDYVSSATVGKIMKRFEILKDKDAIKATIKELVYENYRTLREYIKAFNKGVKFIAPKKQG